MPYDPITGVPLHHSVSAEHVLKGRLLSEDHIAWEGRSIENDDCRYPIAKTITKKSRKLMNQPVSTVGVFALYHSHNKSYVGQGQSGHVKFVQHRNGSWCLVKIMDAECFRNQNTAPIENEAYFLKKLGKLKGFYKVKKPNGNYKYYIMQEWVEGIVLSEHINELKQQDLAKRIDEARKILAAINALNDNDIIHGDTALANFIKKPDGSYELIDFGSAQDRNYKNENKDLNLLMSVFRQIFNADEMSVIQKAVINASEYGPPSHTRLKSAYNSAFDNLSRQVNSNNNFTMK